MGGKKRKEEGTDGETKAIAGFVRKTVARSPVTQVGDGRWERWRPRGVQMTSLSVTAWGVAPLIMGSRSDRMGDRLFHP